MACIFRALRVCELFCLNVILQETAIFRNGLKMTFTQITYPPPNLIVGFWL